MGFLVEHVLVLAVTDGAPKKIIKFKATLARSLDFLDLMNYAL